MATLPSGLLIANGNSADGNILRTDLDYIITQVNALQTGTINTSRLVYNTTIPPSALPAFGTADGIALDSRASSTSRAVQGYGLPFARRTAMSSMQLAELREPAPAYGGFAVPQAGTANVLHWWTQDSIGGFTQRTYALAATDVPEWCVAAKSGVIYVSCTGTIKVRQVNTKTGIVADFVDLGAFNTGHASGAVNVINRVYINRHGTYLYVVGKRTADTNNRRVFQVRVATGAIAEWAVSEDRTIVGLAMNYSGTASTTDTTIIAVATTALVERHFRTIESAFGTTVSTLRTGALDVVAMCEHNHGYVVLVSAGGTFRYEVFTYDESIGVATEPMHSAYINTLLSNAVTVVLGMVSDGQTCFVIGHSAGDGVVFAFDPITDAISSSLLFPRRFWHNGGVAPTRGGGCWTGRCFVFTLNIAAADMAGGNQTAIALW